MQNIHIAKTIKKLCKEKSISIIDLQNACSLSKSFIYDLEKRSASPSCAKISKIADYLDCSVDYLLGRSNNPTINDDVIKLPLVKPDDIPKSSTPTIILPFYRTTVSAGTGSYLYDDTPVEYINVPKSSSTTAADYMLEVRGDSMEPKFFDGDRILVKQSESIFEGEIGIFVLNGESYIKKMGRGELISLNPAYSPIRLHEFDDIRCSGKVIDTIILE